MFCGKISSPCRACRARSSGSGRSITVWRCRTQQVDRRNSGLQAGGAGGTTSYEGLKRADAAWTALRSQVGRATVEPIVRKVTVPLAEVPQYDIAVAGGTLGIFLACALQLKGHTVAVVERGAVVGREQEWNISKRELQALVGVGVLSSAEVEECIAIVFNPIRAGFLGGPDFITKDVLNCGVRPDKLISKVLARFKEAGGTVLEGRALKGADIHPNGVSLSLAQSAPADSAVLTSRLLLDVMGNFSPLVKQARGGQKPDGVCLVVGACCRGPFPDNSTGDLIFTASPLEESSSRLPDCQVFWEAFPAGSGPRDRTTYMFTYLDAAPTRPSLEAMLEEYWERMPVYQGLELDQQVEVLRVLFGFFPTYRDSPLRVNWDRVTFAGDASGVQSPLSFGGFGALTRHLPRLTKAISEALQVDALDSASLGAINAYNPGLSGAWMLQRAITVQPGQQTRPDFVNVLLRSNFAAMEQLGEDVMKPFLQDTVMWAPQTRTLLRQVAADPGFVRDIFRHVGVWSIVDWTRHWAALGLYTALFNLASASKKLPRSCKVRLSGKQLYRWRRLVEEWEYGSGQDYKQH